MTAQPNINKIETDVLVIGGGLAGCWAAIGARESTDRVLLVDKSMVGRSGCSTFAAGVMLAPFPEDDLDEWREEIVVRGEFLNDQDWVTVTLEEQMSRLSQMQEWGFPFERDGDGTIPRIVGRGHQTTRMLMFHGHRLMDEMRKQVLARGITLKERMMITDLLTDEPGGRLSGAIGVTTREGQWVVFNARAIILCSGQMGIRIGGRYGDNLSGDGPAMAYRAGAFLCDMEFTTSCNITLWNRQCEAAGINMIQGHGAYIVNARGERFMEKYDPVLKERSKTYTLGAAFTKESLEGRGPIYVDMRHLKPEIFEKFARVIPKTMQVFKGAGIDPRRELIECTPSVQTPRSNNGDGGIKVDLHCRTGLPGLFAAGASTKILPHGTYAVGGLNLAYCCVSGYRAGQEAGIYARENSLNPLPSDNAIQAYIFEALPRTAKGSTDVEEIIKKIKLVTMPARYSFFKHARRIAETLQEIAEIERDELGKIYAPDPHHLIKALEIRNYVTCARLAYKAALLRKESRGSHFREEYPNRDDRNWLKRLLVARADGQDHFSWEPIPIEKYPVKPRNLDPLPYPVQYYFDR